MTHTSLKTKKTRIPTAIPYNTRTQLWGNCNTHTQNTSAAQFFPFSGGGVRNRADSHTYLEGAQVVVASSIVDGHLVITHRGALQKKSADREGLDASAMNPTDAGVRSDRAVESSTMSHSSKFRRRHTNKAAHAFTFTPRKADTATTADRGRTGFTVGRTQQRTNFHHTPHNTLDVRNYTCGSRRCRRVCGCVCCYRTFACMRVYALALNISKRYVCMCVYAQ